MNDIYIYLCINDSLKSNNEVQKNFTTKNENILQCDTIMDNMIKVHKLQRYIIYD